MTIMKSMGTEDLARTTTRPLDHPRLGGEVRSLSTLGDVALDLALSESRTW